MKQENRGGRRENSGRPKKENKRLRLHITLPPDLHAKIKNTGEASTVIEYLLSDYFNN